MGSGEKQRNPRLQVCLTPEEKAAVEAASEREKRSQSNWVAQAIREKLEQENEDEQRGRDD